MSNHITAIIVDDEQDARDGLELLIKDKLPKVKVISKAKSAQDALETIIDEPPDLLFLDIQMPVHDGFWLADKINNLQIDICIIFVTAYNEYAINAIKHAAFDFLTKPVIPEILVTTVDRFLKNRDIYNLPYKLKKIKTFFRQDRVKFNTYLGFVMILVENIIYCEADKNYSNIFLSNGKTEVITLQLGLLEEKLTKKSFIRISRSILINLDYMERFNRKNRIVVLSDHIKEYDLKVSCSGAKRLLTL